jgi:hypothetical protein
MLFMVVEHYREGRAAEIYRRADERGRMLPDGVDYVNSWVSLDLKRCYQLMRSDNEERFREWLNKWEDLIEFEIVPVMTSNEARRKVLGGKDHED